MKKIFLILFTLLSLASFSQTFTNRMEASIGVGSTSRGIRIYIRPTIAYVGTISTLQFTVGIPASTSPIPTLALTTDNLACSWIIDPSYLEGGYRLYNITTAVSPSVNIAAGVETQVMELTFSSTGNTTSNVSLVTLPDGGTVTFNALFLSTANPGTAGNSEGRGFLYYVRPGTTVNNNNSYDPNFILPGVAASNATITGVVLPVATTNFNAVKKDQDAFVTWNVENQDANADRFEVERSFNGTDFKYVGVTAANTNGNSSIAYNYTDRNITALRGVGVIYYRLKSIDKNGTFVYSQVKDVRLEAATFAINLYPNPSSTYTNLSFELQEASKISVLVRDAAGKTVRTVQVTGVKGINQQKIDVSALASGRYNVTLQTGGKVQTLSFLKSN